MRLFIKTLVIVCVTITTLMAVTYFFSDNIMIQNSIRSDEAGARSGLTITGNAINDSIRQLGTLVKSYSVWDDTYAFLGDSGEAAGQEYLEENMNRACFELEDTDLRILVDGSGETKFCGIYDGESGTVGEGDIAGYLRPGSTLVFPADTDSEAIVNGVMVIGNRSFLVSAAPVLQTDATGPARGTLIFGKRVDRDVIERFNTITHDDVSILTMSDGPLPGDYQAALNAMDAGTGTSITVLNNSWLGAYSLFRDLNGEPAFMIRNPVYRTMYLEAQGVRLEFFVILLGSSVIVCAAIIVLIDRTMLRRLSDMGRRLVQIGREGDLEKNLPGEGDDELRDLAGNINDMLRSLRDSREQLVRSEGKYRSLFDNMPGGCAYIEIVRDADGRPIDFIIQDLNAGGENVLGVQKGELIGRRMIDLAGPDLGEMFEYLKTGGREFLENSGLKGDVYIRRIDRWLNIRLFLAGADSYVLMFDDVTDRKRREEAQLENQRRIDALADDMGYIVWRIDNKACIETADHAGSKSLGYEGDDLTGKPVYDLLYPDDRLAVMIACQSVFSGGKEWEREFRVRRHDGEYRWVLAVISQSWDAKGNAAGATIQGRDITDRKRSEELLRESEEKFRHTIEQSLEGFMLVDETGTIIEYNRALEQVYGYPRDEVVGKKLWDNVHQLLPEKHRQAVTVDMIRKGTEKMLATGRLPPMKKGYRDVTIRRKDGSQRHIQSVDFPISTARGFMIGNMIRDVTERKIAEDALRKSEEKCRMIVNSIAAGVVLIDRETHGIIDVNDQALATFGASREAVVGSVCHRFICPAHEGACPVTDLDEEVDASERIALRADGQQIPILKTVRPGLIGERKVLIESFVDITKLKQAEQALRASEADLAHAQSIAHLGSCHIDMQANRIRISDEFFRIFGLDRTKDNDSYKRFLDTIHPDDREAVEQLDASLFHRGGSASSEFRIVLPDGSQRMISGESRVTLGQGGIPAHFFRIVQDITERKSAEARVLASLKEKEILLKEIHHRVKNNLQIISSLLSLQSGYLKDVELINSFNESRDRIRSMALIHEKLYQSKDFTRIEFAEYAESLSGSLFRSYAGHQGRARYRITGVRADLTIEEGVPCGLIVNELVSNSLKYAFPDRRAGEIVIDIRQDEGNVTITISDNGVGLPTDFDMARSNTLGLQLVCMLVDQLEGKLEIGPGPGTRFTISFARKPSRPIS